MAPKRRRVRVAEGDEISDVDAVSIHSSVASTVVSDPSDTASIASDRDSDAVSDVPADTKKDSDNAPKAVAAPLISLRAAPGALEHLKMGSLVIATEIKCAEGCGATFSLLLVIDLPSAITQDAHLNGKALTQWKRMNISHCSATLATGMPKW